MSNVTGTIRSRDTVLQATDPTIYNVSAPTANTEVSQALSAETKNFSIMVRGNATLKFAFISGNSGTLYITVPPGASYTSSGLNFTGTLYFQTNKASQIVEIIEWA